MVSTSQKSIHSKLNQTPECELPMTNEDIMNLVVFYQSSNLCRLKTVACSGESRH